MTQHTFILPINGASSGIEFEETQYRLNAGEMLVGQQDDIPEKKQIGHVITAFDGIEVFEQELDVREPIQVGIPGYFNIYRVLEDLFGDSTINSKGIHVEFDLHFFMDHLYQQTDPTETVYHFSCTANMLIRFSVHRAETQDYYYSDLQYLNRRGKWVQYNSVSEPYVPYESVVDSGDLDFDPLGDPPFTLSIETTGTNAGMLKIENHLDHVSGFHAGPLYNTIVFGKMKVFEYSLNDTYTYEQQQI